MMGAERAAAALSTVSFFMKARAERNIFIPPEGGAQPVMVISTRKAARFSARRGRL